MQAQLEGKKHILLFTHLISGVLNLFSVCLRFVEKILGFSAHRRTMKEIQGWEKLRRDGGSAGRKKNSSSLNDNIV